MRKQNSYTENKVFPYLTIDDFDKACFDKVRKLVKLTNANHPWSSMTDDEILMSGRMRLKDIHTGKEGYTLAAALLFGKENTLASVLPHYKTDALCRKFDVERYDDRDDIRSNLIYSYPRLLAFVQKHLPDRFYLEGTQRISIRDIIFREVVANLLVHREFSNAYPATLAIYQDTVVTENWSRPYIMGRISLDNLSPHPKNPTIANFFKQLGWVEELGSGVHKMYKYCPIYANGAMPDIEESDIFRLSIRYEPVSELVSEGINEGVSEGVNEGVSEEEKLILTILKQTAGLNAKSIAEKIKKSNSSTERYIRNLKQLELIEFRGVPKKGGYFLIK